MPATRNISARRSRRLSGQAPTNYNEGIWEEYPFEDDTTRSVSPNLTLQYPEMSPDTTSSVSPNLVLQYPTMSPVSPLVSEPDEMTYVASSSQLPARRRSHSKKRDPDRIRRPRNPFMVFRSYYYQQMLNTNSSENHQALMSKKAGEIWNTLPEEEKAEFKRQAHIEKLNHARLYPDYKYAPKIRKASATSKRSLKKKKDEEQRCDRVATLVRQGVVGDNLASAMKEEIQEDPTTSNVVLPTKEQSPVIAQQSLYEPDSVDGGFVLTEHIPPLDLNADAMEEPTFSDCVSPVGQASFDQLDFESGYTSTMHPLSDNTILPQLPQLPLYQTSDQFMFSSYQAAPWNTCGVQTFYNYDDNTVKNLPGSSNLGATQAIGDWSHTAMARTMATSHGKQRDHGAVIGEKSLQYRDFSILHALSPPTLVPRRSSFEKLQDLGANLDRGFDLANLFKPDDLVNLEFPDWLNDIEDY